MKYILPVILSAILLLLPQTLYCSDSLNVRYIVYDDEGGHTFRQKPVDLPPYASLFTRVNTVLSALFSLDMPDIYPYPEGVQVLRLHYIRGHLTVTLSDEIAAFGGGTMLERIYLGQILKNLLYIDGVDVVSIKANTPEGLSVREGTCWSELLYGIILQSE